MDEVAARFGAPDRDCIIRVSARSGDLFEPRALAAQRSLAERLAAVDGVEQVRSMFDIRRRGVAGAVLPVIPRVEGELTAAEGEAARARAVEHPLIRDHLLSADASAGLLIARLEAAADRPPRLGEVVAGIERLLTDAEREGGGLKLDLTGLPALREQAAQALRHDMLFFNSLGLGLAVVLSACVARSARSTVVA
ncbi:MAG: MMPL family transporter, partial [Planctomycetia bacterium]